MQTPKFPEFLLMSPFNNFSKARAQRKDGGKLADTSASAGNGAAAVLCSSALALSCWRHPIVVPEPPAPRVWLRLVKHWMLHRYTSLHARDVVKKFGCCCKR